MVLADTNLIIYATRPDYAVVANWLLQSAPACSAITRVEALGYHRLMLATDLPDSGHL